MSQDVEVKNRVVAVLRIHGDESFKNHLWNGLNLARMSDALHNGIGECSRSEYVSRYILPQFLELKNNTAMESNMNAYCEFILEHKDLFESWIAEKKRERA